MVEKSIELTGMSANSIEDAVNIALARAAVTIDGIRHVHVEDIAATVEGDAVMHWRVRIRITFAVQDRLHE
jgi:flavin-binding protein dodecin